MTMPMQPQDPLNAAAPPPPPFAKSLAVIIGINEYGEGIPALLNAVNDANAVARTLRERHGYEVIQLTDREASQEQVKELLYKTLPGKVDEDHRVFFYWAGHGVKTDSDTGPDGYLLPSDARKGKKETYLHMPGVHDALLDLRCRHMLVVLDTCFSGAFRWSGMRGAVREGEVIHQQTYDRFVRDAAWQVISSASQDQLASDELILGERQDDAGHHSPFARFLFEAIDGKADVIGGVSGGGDGLVTAHELYLYVDDQLARAPGVRQKAQLWPLKKHDKGEFIFQVRDKLELPPAPTLTYENNPWLGLKSYDEDDEDLFFGREDLLETPARDADPSAAATPASQPPAVPSASEPPPRRRLVRQVEENPLTVVYGASGAGKTSLVRAGLVPRLKKRHWRVLPVIRPGPSPFKALLKALDPKYAATATVTMESATATVTTESATATVTAELPSATATYAHATPADIQRSEKIRTGMEDLLRFEPKVVLVVDRFEELVTLSPRSTREAFLSLLADLLRSHPGLHVVVTVRSDFEPIFDATALGDWWRREEGRCKVEPMSRDELRDVIELPAAKRVLYFKPSSLVDKLVEEVAATPGALPLLSFALSQMYIAYLDRRGDDRAITEDDYEKTGGVVGALRKRADEVYRGLASPEQETARHLMLRMVVREGGHMAGRRVTNAELDFPDDAENARKDTVLRRLTRTRLLVGDQELDEAFYEPAHDALVREWGQLQEWVREEDEAASPDGARPGGVRPGTTGKGPSSAGRPPRSAPYTLEQRQRLARAAGEWTDANDRTRPGLLWHDRVQSGQLRALVTPRAPWLNKRELAFSECSIQRRRRGDVVWYTVWLVIGLLAGTSFAFGVRATVLAALAVSRQLSAETQSAVADGDLDRAALLAVEASALPAPDIRSPLLTWELSTAKLLGYLPDTVGVRAVALSPDGGTLASAQAPTGAVTESLPRWWSARWWSTRWHRLTGALPDTVGQVRSPRQCGGRSANTVVLWDVARRRLTDTLCVPNDSVVSLAYAGPDSAPLLAGATADGGIYLLDAHTRLLLEELREGVPGPAPHVADLAFSPGGGILALADSNRIVAWDVLGPRRLGRLRARRNPNEPERPHPGKEMEGTAREDTLAALPKSRIIDSWIEGQRPIRSITFSPATHPDTQTLVAVTDGAVTMWRIMHRAWRVVKPNETLWSIGDSSPRVWPGIYRRNRAGLFTQPHWIYPGDTLDLGFVRAKIVSHLLPGVVSVAFSPDGRTLAVARKDTTVHLWNVSPWQLRESLRGHPGGATRVAFRPRHDTRDRSTVVAAATASGAIVLWDVTQKGNPRRIGEPLLGHGDAVTSLAFTPDGQTLISASEDGRVAVWSITARPPRSEAMGLKVTLMTGRDGKVSERDVSRRHRQVGLPPLDSAYRVFGIAFSIDTGVVADGVRWNLGSVPTGPFSVVPSDSTLALLRADTLFLTDTTGRAPHRLASTGVSSVTFGPRAGEIASAHLDGRVSRWKHLPASDSLQLARTFSRRGSGPATSIAFSPDSSSLASGYEDGTVVRWSLISGRRLGASRGHTGRVQSLAYSPDALTLASASADSTVILWDAEGMRRRGEPVRGLFRSLAFSPDSATLAAVSDSGRVTFWDFRVDSMKQAACAAAGRNLSRPEWSESFSDRYKRACGLYEGHEPVSGAGWPERRVNWVVRRLADAPRLLDFLGYAWKWFWLPLLIPWMWLWQKGRPSRRLSRSAS